METRTQRKASTASSKIEVQKITPCFMFSGDHRGMAEQAINYYWEKLTRDGDVRAQVCGWLQDKFGVSWQVLPVALGKWISDPDTMKSDRVMKALFPMKKIDLRTLKKAFEQ